MDILKQKQFQSDSFWLLLDLYPIIDCIDHIYTNRKFRCSDATPTAFSGSDHDVICYTRYSKDPPEPARTIKKISYKKFDDWAKVDFTDV